MPKRKAPEPHPDAFERMGSDLECDEASRVVADDPEQYRRFVEAAQELGADSPETGAVFEQALRRVLSHRAPNGPTSKREPSRKPKRERSRQKIPKQG